MERPTADEIMHALRLQLDMERKRAEKAEAAHLDSQKQIAELQSVCLQMSRMFSLGDNKRGDKGRSGGGINTLVKDADARIKLCLDMHQQFVYNMWERRKIMPPNWDKFSKKKGTTCHQMMFNIRRHIPKPWTFEPFWHVWVVPSSIEVLKNKRADKTSMLHKVFDSE